MTEFNSARATLARKQFNNHFLMKLAAELKVYSIGSYEEVNYQETVNWLRKLADFIEENKGGFAQDFTARRFFKEDGVEERTDVLYELKNGNVKLVSSAPNKYGRDPFPPRI